MRLEVLDVMVPGPDELETGVAFIGEHVDKEQTVLVHCAKGRGRSATLLAAYLMSNEGMSYNQAQQILVSKRSLVNLQGRHRRIIESWIEARSGNGEPASSDPSESGSSAGSADS